MFTSPSQIICTVFGVHIYYYGVILALAIIAGTFISEFLSTRYFNLKKDTVTDMVPYLVIFGIIGARLYYCALNYDFYLRFPTEIIAIRHGGIAIHGAMLGGLAGLFIFAKRHKLSLFKLADITVPGLAFAQSIGRWGNFFNSEAFGTPTNLPWKLYIPHQYRPIPYENCEFFHPTFLYESILDLGIFLMLYIIIKKDWAKKEGNLAFIYLILYSIARIFVEHYRIDSVLYIHGISIAIIISAGIIFLALLGIIIRKIQKES